MLLLAFSSYERNSNKLYTLKNMKGDIAILLEILSKNGKIKNYYSNIKKATVFISTII